MCSINSIVPTPTHWTHNNLKIHLSECKDLLRKRKCTGKRRTSLAEAMKHVYRKTHRNTDTHFYIQCKVKIANMPLR